MFEYPSDLRCGENLNIACFALYPRCKTWSTKKHFPFHGWEISNQGGNVEKSICNPKLFVPLVKVINSMLEQNLHRLHFHKILKLWEVSINFERWVGPSEIVRYRVKLEWWIKFKLEVFEPAFDAFGTFNNILRGGSTFRSFLIQQSLATANTNTLCNKSRVGMVISDRRESWCNYFVGLVVKRGKGVN